VSLWDLPSCADCPSCWGFQVRGLEFSELTPNRLASGAEQGELCIWDLKNPVEPVVYPPLKVLVILRELRIIQEDRAFVT
jgi:WD40 repeat protein